MDIAIVGGGAAAVSMLDALAAEAGGRAGSDGEHSGSVVDRGSVTVWEPAPTLWRGRAYAPDLAAVLVNTVPPLMSVRHGDFGHFPTWLGPEAADHLDPLLGQPLVPRARYGDYLADTAQRAVAALRARGWQVRVRAERVTAVVRSGTRLAVRGETGPEQLADRVALCVGGGTPPDVYGLTGAPGFTADPYPLVETVDRMAGADAVAVLGSGLTAVDVVVALAARRYQGKITLLSRTGVLPYVWQRPDGRRPARVTVSAVAQLHRTRGELGLDDLAGLLRAELADAGEDFDELLADLRGAGRDDPTERLRRQLATVTDDRRGRRVLQETAHTVGPYAWPLLRESDRAWLRRHLRAAASVASPMVPVNASVVLRLLDSGQLTLVSGVAAIELRQGQFVIRDATGRQTTAPVVVNAVNPPAHAVPVAAGPLVTSLTGAGLVAGHPSGGAVPTDPRVRVVGDLAGGSFITSSVAGVAARAARAAEELLAG